MQLAEPGVSSVEPAGPLRPSLEALIAGAHFTCRDGDILGREGTVGATALRTVRSMSRRHLLVQWKDEKWQLTLLPSARNVTVLDEEALVAGTPRTLSPGDHRVQIEHHSIDFHVGGGLVPADPDAPEYPPALERLRDEVGKGGLFGLLAEHIADLIAIIDQHGRRIWNNAAYLTCLGYSPQEINETYSMAEVHPDDLPAVQRVFEESMRTLVGQRLEYRMKHRDGHWVYLESRARVVAPPVGGNKYLVLVARDITERRRAETLERERIRRQSERAATLTEFTRSRMFQAGDLTACFAAVTEAAVKHLDCERAGVWLFSANGQHLACPDEYVGADKTHGPGPRLPPASCARFLNLLRAERCVVMEEGTASDSRLHDLRAGYLWPRTAADFLTTRVGLGTEVIGMVTLERTTAEGGWTMEDQAFASWLADMLHLCVEARLRVEAFTALQESQRQIAADLHEAGNYVRALLPPPLTGGDVESEWRVVPCSELGGDGLGHRWLDEDHLAIYLIDSVGHGVSAALLAISVLNILRSGSLPATNFHDPSQVLAALNRSFQMETQNNMFFTVWYGVYHRPTRKLVYATAAHPPAVLFDVAGGTAELLGGEGLMIGAQPGTVYANEETTVATDGRLYVYSDGAFEIMTPEGAPWGFDSFLACLGQLPEDGGSELDALRQTAEHVNGRPDLPDDFSILRLTFH